MFERDQRSFAEHESFYERPFSETSGAWYTRANSGEWQGRQSSRIDGANPTHTSSTILEESEEPAATTLSESFYLGNRGVFNLKKKAANASSPVTTRKVQISLAVLFFLGLLLVSLKYQICFKDAKDKIAGEVEKAEGLPQMDPLICALAVKEQTTKAKLEKVKALLPAAKRLAFAVATGESMKLLTTVTEIIRETGLAASATDSKKLEGDLKRALLNLRRLHEAAVKRGEEMLQATKSLHPIPPLHQLIGVDAETQIGEDQKARNLLDGFLVNSYQGFYESATRLYERLSYADRRLEADRRFESEEDEEVLLDTALTLESLSTTKQDLQMLQAVTAELKTWMHAETKSLLLIEHEETLKTLEVELNVQRLYAYLAKNAMNNTEPAHLTSVDKVRAALSSMEKDLEQAKLLVERAKKELLELQNSQTLLSAKMAAQRVEKLEAQAEKLLQKWLTRRETFTDLEVQLNVRGSQVMNKIAEKMVRSVERTNEKLRKIASNLKSRFAEDLKDDGVEGKSIKQHLSLNLVRDLLQAVEEIGHQGDACVTEARALQEKVKGLKTMTAAWDELLLLNVLMRNQGMRKAMLCMTLPRLYLIDFLGNELERLTERVAHAPFHDSYSNASEKQKYTQAKDLFNLARRAATEADNLLEVIQAVNQLRLHAITVDDIFYKFEAAYSH